MKIRTIMCLAGILMLAASSEAMADEVYKEISPTYDTYIDKRNPDKNNGKSETMFLLPVTGNFADREDSNRSYGLIRFDIDSLTEEDLSIATCIKLRLTTADDVNEDIVTNGMNGDYNKVTDKPMADVLQVLGLQLGLDDDGETVISYKTSWDENTTWNTAGGLQLPTNGNALRGCIVDACSKNTTYELDVTDYVVYTKLYEENDSNNVVSFKLQKMLQNYLWNENKFENGFSIYSMDAKDASKRPALVVYTLSDQEIVEKALDEIDLGDLSCVYRNLTLPNEVNGIKLTWSSNSTSITDDGAITLGDKDVKAVLTVSASYNDVTATREFEVTVKSKEYIRELLEKESASITFSKFSDEAVNRVTKNLTLPSKIIEGCDISYSSSNSSVLDINGTEGRIYRSENDQKAVFKVRLWFDTMPDIYIEKEFNIIVKGTESGTYSGGGGGGGNSSGSESVKVPGLGIGAQQPVTVGSTQYSQSKNIFNDISDDFWAKEYIEGLKNMGIVDGDENGNFRPNDKITREETAKLIVLAFKLYDESAECGFEDVSPDAWYYRYIASAFKAGVVKGMSDKQFGTGMPITRQDLSVMLYNALKALGKISEYDIADSVFTDDSDIADYAHEAVYYLRSSGILDGYENGSFLPVNAASRAEVAKVIYMLVKN